MVSLDTLKMQVPAESVRGADLDIFRKSTIENPKTGHTEVLRKAMHEYLPSGIVGIKYKDERDFELTISAKILKENYLQGINLNTFEQAIQGVSPVLDIDLGILWDMNPIIHLCDSTDNIELERLQTNQKGVCDALKIAKTNNFFHLHSYETSKKLGVEFRGGQKSKKNRFIAYDKYLDLYKGANQKFMDSLSNASRLKMLEDAKKIIRIETNHSNYSTIRDRFGITENRLQNVLLSSKPVNYDFLKKVISPRSKQMCLFDEYKSSNLNYKDYIERKGIEHIIIELEYDETNVREFLKMIAGENFKYIYKRKKVNNIRAILKEMQSQRMGNDISEVSQIVQRLMNELLKVA